ncbi:MAG TPA: hypothetical protein VMB71_12160 [Acetobacteraceae bacterium]|nr:hypothetical protein [Acetobacteraceae bacterium]
MAKRTADLLRFYRLLGELETLNGGLHRMAQADPAYPWPRRGVLWFYERGEVRSDTGDGMRVVRVATHALKPELQSSLWDRMAHDASGTHRGSIFRTTLGLALRDMMGKAEPVSWGRPAATPIERKQETALEAAVSLYAGQMPFLYLAVDDEPGPMSQRGFIEKNSIALLSNYARPPLDAPSSGWLGRRSGREKIMQSGLWNIQHVDGAYDPSFMDAMRSLMEEMRQA